VRIVTWNANMAFLRKLQDVQPMNADISVIPECSRADSEKLGGLWVGSQLSKGLAVIAEPPWSVHLDPAYDERLRWILPVHVSGPTSFFLLGVWNIFKSKRRHPDRPARGVILQALDVYSEQVRASPTVVAGDFNNNVHWDTGRRAQNMANVIAAMDDRRLVSAYHAFTSEAHGAESQPTIYWRDRKVDGPRFHIDFCFIPNGWLPALEAVEVGGFADYVGRGLSDHVPLVVNLAAITRRPLT
jgi:exodeoxyribonuclease-3